MRIALTVAIVSTLGLCFPLEEALGACAKGASRVEVTIDGGSPELSRSIRVELDSELRRSNLCTETASDDKAPLAHIDIVLSGDADATVRIVDGVTKKTVERTLSVAGLPADGRALPIAIAADELLRASWAEVTLHDGDRTPPKDVPKVVRESVERPKPSPKYFIKHNEIGVTASGNVYGGGQAQLGGALFYRREFVSWLSASIFAYGRDSLTAHANDGTIRAFALGGGLTVDAYLARVGRLRLGPEIGAEAGYVRFRGNPESGAKGSSFSSATSFGSLGLALAVDLSPMRLSASLLALAPFHTASALDGRKVVTGLSGPGFHGNFGAGVTF